MKLLNLNELYQIVIECLIGLKVLLMILENFMKNYEN